MLIKLYFSSEINQVQETSSSDSNFASELYVHQFTLMPSKCTLYCYTVNVTNMDSWKSELHILEKYINYVLFFCIYWNIFDLQCCINFRYATNWFSYTHMHISSLSQIIFPYRLLQSIKCNSLCYMADSFWLSIC